MLLQVTRRHWRSALLILANPNRRAGLHKEGWKRVGLCSPLLLLQVYKEALESPLLEAVHLTVVEAEAECDTFMPPVDESRFRLWSASAPRRDAPDAPRYSFLCYTRVGGASLEGPPALPPAVAAPHEEYQVGWC